MTHPVFKLDCASSCGKSEKLMTETDAHYGKLTRFHKATKVVNGILAVNGI